MYENRIRKADYLVSNCGLKEAQELVKQFHYAKGGSNTACYTHGLYSKQGQLVGIAWWLPPTRVAAESVNRTYWKQVLALTRLVVIPNVPKNAAGMLLARSIKLIRRDRRFVSLVTYADESQNHLGTVYKATNWLYVGRTGPYPRWIDPTTGRQVAAKATFNRTKSVMESLGYIKIGSFYKHKFVMHLKI